jgi:hypothetical protein
LAPVKEAGDLEKLTMHTVEMLEQALALARRAGYQVRQEWLGGRGGGGCEFNGQKWIFLDLALGLDDQLESVLDALRHEPAVASLPTPHPLGKLLGPLSP